MTAAQVRAARKLLNWTPERLAQRAKVTVGIVLQAERDAGHAVLSPAAARSIVQALESAGVERVEPVGLVRLRR